ncbi:hypothetical protein WICPIJ_004439 [Wickerhamomyces pijperi]|uniref:GH16 domain-containing protein n=1 Tax=Wickerhamomyces pijperi TaxID=599730 RepID=A0A9P8Q7X8_WICPI|nr:hypothetical protein WICPIJ_004439 [Wickerhamomyces pijperi]
MSYRHLTGNSPNPANGAEGSDIESINRNPFLQEDNTSFDQISDNSSSEDIDSSANMSQSQHRVSSSAAGAGANVSKPFLDYKGYYANQESSASVNKPLINSTSSSNLSNFQTNNNNGGGTAAAAAGGEVGEVGEPGSFDRYPAINNGKTSRYPSMAHSISSQSKLANYGRSSVNPNKDTSLTSDDSVESSANPFQVDADFSPFGGYPASSFPLLLEEKEADDYLHNPDPVADAEYEKNRFMSDLKNGDKRTISGLIGLVFLLGGLACVFIVLPVLTYSGITEHNKPTVNVYELLTLYEYPTLGAIRTSLIDPDTPSEALTKNTRTGETWKLVFSDEFNAEGRTFYDGDDQFWTAPNIHYQATVDLEWYDPDAATTVEGTLQLKMDAFKNHNLFYRSGMLQSWNKFCFTQGKLEVSAKLPNYGRVAGLWPGIWTMGNLGRPGYLSTTDGVWPYAYSSCDAGITANQSSSEGISYQKGQRLNACTCDGEDHPNPGVGRGAPEIDALEGATDTTLEVGVASQSLQIAPYDVWYMPDYDFIEIYNHSVTTMNTYAGGPFQQAVSAVSTLNDSWYQLGANDTNSYQTYGIEYLNDDDTGYCTWLVGNNPTWTIYSQALHPNGNVGWRHISKEPMSIILNLGVSNSWAYIDWPSIVFPAIMQIDYVRVYQPSDAISVTCDPSDYPTYDYIQSHLNAYTNPNLTSWNGAGYEFPKDSLTGNCKSSNFKSSS